MNAQTAEFSRKICSAAGPGSRRVNALRFAALAVMLCVAFILLQPAGTLAGEKDAAPFRQNGTASWISRNFAGEPTASGESYDPDALIAAHNYLPLGSMVMVTNLENNKTVTVRVNDRGPLSPKRIIDVSWAAAERLGVVEEGGENLQFTFPVRVRAVGVAQKPEQPAKQRAAPASALYYIQAGAFSQKPNAVELAASLQEHGFERFRIIDKIRGTRRLYKVQVGPFKQLEPAEQALETVRREVPGAFVISVVASRVR
jgi:rare lipoprotein A